MGNVENLLPYSILPWQVSNPGAANVTNVTLGIFFFEILTLILASLHGGHVRGLVYKNHR
jgi:hypothetical protein